ncbi:DUF4394 domain-containing protein [soil metagenome]
MTSHHKASLLGCASLLALSFGATAANAASLVGLTAHNKLVKIDTAAMTAAPATAISVPTIVSIDVRPADGQLYGLTAAGQIVVIDAMSAKATAGSMLSEKATLGARPVVDFNPVADRLRVITADGTSLRIDVDIGATTVDKPLNYHAADPHAARKPMVAAGAYTNSSKGAKGSELFNIDGDTGVLVLQNPPNDGVLKTRGSVSINALADAAMDIDNEAEGKNTAYVVAGGTLYTIDLATGKSTQVGAIKGIDGKLVDIAVWK